MDHDATSPPVAAPSWMGRITRPFAATLLLLLVSALIYFPLLGRSGFTLSEGHRAIPGFEALHAWREGRFSLLTTMFEQVYLRKPPGMPWAVAISASLFGESEWSARLVSALASTVMVFTAWWFARRWFGERFALAAGLMQALTPLWWTVGRSAEIESLNNAATQAAAFIIIDRLLNVHKTRQTTTRRATEWFGWALLLTAALVLMLLAKGPASVPVVAVAAVASVLARGGPGWRGTLRAIEDWHGSWVVRVPAMLAVAATGWYLFALREQIQAAGVTPVLQSPGEFLWSGARGNGFGEWLAALGKVLAMGPIALAAALPASIFLLSILRPNPRRDESDARRLRLARALVATCLGAIGVYMLVGVGNPRYAMPACVVLAPLVAFACAELAARSEAARNWSDRVVAWLMIRRPGLTIGVLMLAAWGFIALSESQRDRSSGRAVGQDLGHALAARLNTAPGSGEQNIELWANDLVEARPEVLYYAGREVPGTSARVRAIWTPGLGTTAWPPPGGWVALRVDAGSAEAGLALRPDLDQVFKGRVAQFEFIVARVRGKADIEAQAPAK